LTISWGFVKGKKLMSKSYYIASAIGNYKQVLDAEAYLAENNLYPSFDWAEVYKDQLSREKTLSKEDKVVLAEQMEKGIRQASALLLILPAKRGAHVEFGIARGAGIPCVVYAADTADHISFYALPGVKLYDDLDAAVDEIRYILEAKASR
jgi:hypothetical protein